MNELVHIPIGRFVRCFAGWLTVLALAPALARGQTWEYSPYEIHVWVAVSPANTADKAMRQRLAIALEQRADVAVGSPWTVVVSSPPESLWADVAFALDEVTTAQIEQAAEKSLNQDKLMLLAIEKSQLDTRIRARELDCRVRMWGPVIERRIRNSQLLETEAFAALFDAFSPVTRIETGEGKQATVRIRSGGLILNPGSPAAVAQGDVLIPITRTNDRYGKPMPGRISIIPWTLLQVAGRDERNPSILNCNVHSGMRSPIRGRVSSRRERYALGVQPTLPETELVLESRTRRRDEPGVPLADLEVYSTIPSVEPVEQRTAEQEQEEQRRNPPELLGYTDWLGRIRIEPAETPLRVLYIKNGGQLLARLPIVPGAEAVQVAQVPDDNPRLQAEGYIKGLSGEIMDLVAQRQILAARIRKRVSDGKLDEAEDLMDEFRELKTRNDMQRALDRQMQRQMESPYASVKARIDQLYGETRSMLGKYLDPNLGNQLLRELRAAQQQSGG
jgi:hypothetical protein